TGADAGAWETVAAVVDRDDVVQSEPVVRLCVPDLLDLASRLTAGIVYAAFDPPALTLRVIDDSNGPTLFGTRFEFDGRVRVTEPVDLVSALFEVAKVQSCAVESRECSSQLPG